MKTKDAIATPTWADAVKETKREHVLRAARDEFLEKGLEGATMRGIALRSACTTGAIYPLFASKEAIYAALIEQSLERLDTAVVAAIDEPDPPALQVEKACLAFVDYYLEHQFEVNLGLYAFRGLKRQGTGRRSDPALNHALQAVLDRIAGPLAACRGIPDDEARPLVTLLFTQMIGALVLQIAGRLTALATDAPTMVRLMLAQVLGNGAVARGARGKR